MELLPLRNITNATKIKIGIMNHRSTIKLNDTKYEIGIVSWQMKLLRMLAKLYHPFYCYRFNYPHVVSAVKPSSYVLHILNSTTQLCPLIPTHIFIYVARLKLGLDFVELIKSGHCKINCLYNCKFFFRCNKIQNTLSI